MCGVQLGSGRTPHIAYMSTRIPGALVEPYTGDVAVDVRAELDTEFYR